MYSSISRVDIVVADELSSRIDAGTGAVDVALSAAVASCLGSVKSCVPNLLTKKLNFPTVNSKPDSRSTNVSRTSGECGLSARFVGEVGELPMFERIGELPYVDWIVELWFIDVAGELPFVDAIGELPFSGGTDETSSPALFFPTDGAN